MAFPIPIGFFTNLIALGAGDPMWATEAKVNGIWNAMLSRTFVSNMQLNDFLTCPEPVPAGDRKVRPDLVVFQITAAPPNTRMQERVVYEGKNDAANNFDKIGAQLYEYFRSRGPLTWSAWAIGASGHVFRIWKWDHTDKVLHPRSLDVHGQPTVNAAADIDLLQHTAAQLSAFCIYLANNPTPP